MEVDARFILNYYLIHIGHHACRPHADLRKSEGTQLGLDGPGQVDDLSAEANRAAMSDHRIGRVNEPTTVPSIPPRRDSEPSEAEAGRGFLEAGDLQ